MNVYPLLMLKVVSIMLNLPAHYDRIPTGQGNTPKTDINDRKMA